MPLTSSRIIMPEPGESKVIVKDHRANSKKKTNEQVVKENNMFVRQLGDNMSKEKKAELTEQELKERIAAKKAAKLAAEKAKEQAAQEDDTTQEVLDKRSGQEEAPKVKEGEKEMATGATAKKHVSLKFGIVGSGQAGGRIAEVFSRYGYDIVAINTAAQDLEFLEIDKSRKFLLETKDKNFGGAGKDLEIGAACIEAQENEVRDFVEEKLNHCDALILAISGGGGSGSGSAETLSYLLYEMGKPVIVVYVLPGAFDDPQSKHNSVVTLSKLADLSSQQVINSLVLVDNANIERKLSGASQAAFFETANQAVVEPLHMFNSVSVTPTSFEALDSMDFAKSLIEAGNCVVFGTNKVPAEHYEDDEMAIMDAIIEGLEDGLLASGFDLREAQNVGILVTANQAVLEKIPFTSIAFMFKYVADEFDSAKSFKGVYAIPTDNDDITVRFIFSGMGLPKGRVDSLKTEAETHMKNLESKKRKTQMNVGLNRDKATDEIDRRIAKAKRKKSGIGKLLGGQKPVKRRR